MTPDLMLDLVREGLVIALLAPAVIPKGAEDLRTIPITAGPSRIEYLAWSDFNPSPAAQAFIDGLRDRETHKHEEDLT
jgi:DNA-binding transcriptional LysR family regulator